MKIAVACPHCQKRYQLNGELAGKRVKCAQCATPFAVPQPTSVAPAIATAPRPAAAPAARPSSPARPASSPAQRAQPTPARPAAARPAAPAASKPATKGRATSAAVAGNGTAAPRRTAATAAAVPSPTRSLFEEELDGGSLSNTMVSPGGALSETIPLAPQANGRAAGPGSSAPFGSRPTARPGRGKTGALHRSKNKIIAGIGSLGVLVVIVIVRVVVGTSVREAIRQATDAIQATPAASAGASASPVPQVASAPPALAPASSGTPAEASGASRYEVWTRDFLTTQQRIADMIMPIHDSASGDLALPNLRTAVEHARELLAVDKESLKSSMVEHDRILNEQLVPKIHNEKMRIVAGARRLAQLTPPLQNPDLLRIVNELQQNDPLTLFAAQQSQPANPQVQSSQSSNPRYETACREALATMRRVGDLMESIHDRPSAQAVLPQLNEAIAHLRNLATELQNLESSGTLSEHDRAISAQLLPEINAQNERIKAQTDRVTRLGNQLQMGDLVDRLHTMHHFRNHAHTPGQPASPPQATPPMHPHGPRHLRRPGT